MIKVRKSRLRRRGFTMLELQVAVILLALGVMTMASLLTTQQRTLKKLRGDFVPASTLYVTRSNDPWQQKMNVAARITSAPITQGAAPTALVHIQNVSIVSTDYDLTGEGITVTADVSP